MHTEFAENLKKCRLAKGFTQEQVAERLLVNPQTVSRWECGTTLPDVLTLPVLAKLYEVTVDDFYKKSTFAYKNYAQRLSSVFEQSHDFEDFMQCRNEYLKLIRAGELSTEDKWMYGWIHKCMMNCCKNVAAEWFDKAVQDDPENDPDNFHHACMQRMAFYFQIGEGENMLTEQTEKASRNPDDPRAADDLLLAMIYADKYEEAYAVFKAAIAKFPDDWRMHIHGGDIAKKLGKFEEALACYNRAGELGTAFCDELYCKANLYEAMGDCEKAAAEYMRLADTLRRRGFDVEADAALADAREMKSKIKKER